MGKKKNLKSHDCLTVPSTLLSLFLMDQYNLISLVLDIYAVFFRSGDFDAYLESCFRVWVVFLKFRRKNYTKAPLIFLSDIFYWELNDHPILNTIKAELPKFSDSIVEIIKYGHYINQLRLDDNGFRENIAHKSTWAAYEYSLEILHF